MPSDDPRDSALETRFTPPKTWFQESVDGLATSGMFLSGLIMVTRNRYLAWPALIFAINSYINQHPLRTKEGGTPPIGNVLLSFFALIASYLPLFLKAAPSAPSSQAPLF
ncbi:hypothetical protein HETIRDRAFT_105528 [Heterobasidion irregulare TC 32-1]|uniref:Uncharacterized protein n=1 Tax=Heterobasidion irregulare (strain TC 32-1) TaxID=747525 RepID=W4JW66_HETIT|nr:uncharacterized protein HETIRDRAFT_105528 [Heterobasidion irregulare TC 32-1]ETW77320.1 hypothetical protein HETIRDRAFT_105528 [Heterobasidion irregulare TC 32-1]